MENKIQEIKTKLRECERYLDTIKLGARKSHEQISETYKATKKFKALQMAILHNELEFLELEPKAGDFVYIKDTNQRCGCVHETDMSKPYQLLLYKERVIITPESFDFVDSQLNLGHNSYCTLIQDGKLIIFASDTNTDYIIKKA